MNSYKIRVSFIFCLFIAFYLVILFNLYLIQITRSTFFSELGEKQYLVTISSLPPRAPIYDRTGKQFLAMNKQKLSAFILPSHLKNRPAVESFLQEHFPAAYRRLQNNKNHNFMFVTRRLSDAQVNHIKQAELPDIKFLSEPSRYYPIPAAGPIVGLTDIDNNGLFGIELQNNPSLSGLPTICTLEKDARSDCFYFNQQTHIAGKEGQPVTLTIDADLQFLAYEEIKETVKKFKAKEGAAIILNPDNGEIITMATYPCFNPNNTKQLDLETTKNKILTECYELGSVIKVCAALALLEEEVVTPDELIDCRNTKTTYIDGRRVNTSFVDGVLPFTQVIAKSNNIGMGLVVTRIGTLLYDYYKKLGFGSKTNLGFPGEQSGFLNPPQNWSKQSIFSLSYGYEVSATLLQLARVFAIIANEGKSVKPKLYLSPEASESQQEQLFKPNTIHMIKEILHHTTEFGSTRRARIKGYTIMSKTGTANLLIDGKYESSKNIFTCAGIIKKDSYQRVIVTFVKESEQKNLFASTVAAPLFERIAQKTIIHDKII